MLCDVRWYSTAHRDNKYNQGHIPGSIFVDLDEHGDTLVSPKDVTRYRTRRRSQQVWGPRINHKTLLLHTTVAACHGPSGVDARVLGHDTALLDGGCRSGLVSSNLSRVRSERPSNREWPTELFADADAAATAGNDSSQVLIDARSPDRFSGENEPVDPKAGHIPGAINLPFAQNLSPDGFFESPELLRQRFQNAGCTEGSATVMYCGSGVSACNNLLAFEHAGLEGTLYAGSWSQWSNSADRPVETSYQKVVAFEYQPSHWADILATRQTSQNFMA